MPGLAEYTITETLQENDGLGLYRATRNRDRHPVLLKTPLADDSSMHRERWRLRHEWAVTRALDVPAILKIEDCDESSDRPVLVLEDFGGVSLDQYLRGPLPLGEFLNM